MNNGKEYGKYFKPIDEYEMKQWKAAPKSFTTELFEAFLNSENNMVEVNMDELPQPKHKESTRLKATKQDSFASAFYAWKRKRREYLESKKLDVLLIRRGERIALKKVVKH